MGTWSPNSSRARAGFDVDTFKKLVALFDSNRPNEAETAFRKAMLMCLQGQKRFCDAALEAYGDAGNATQLELDQLRELLDQRERQGAALADARDRLERDFVQYRQMAERELKRLQQTVGTQNASPCRSCEWKRILLAAIAAWPLGKFWFSNHALSSAFGLSPFKSTFVGVLFLIAPLFFVVLRWQWLAFKRKHNWQSWRDNNVYRTVASGWNRFLQRLTLT